MAMVRGMGYTVTMAYRDDMPEEERKARQRAKTAAYRERQKSKMTIDPEYAVAVKAKRAEADKIQYEKEDPKTRNAKWLEWHNIAKQDPEYVERKNQSTKRSYYKNREQRLQEYKEWYSKNDRSAYNLAWSRANPEKRHESKRRRKALIKGATQIESFTKDQIWERDKGFCGICGLLAKFSDWHLDHIIPLSRGGQHTMDNVQVSHPKCNLSKNAKLPSEMASITGGE